MTAPIRVALFGLGGMGRNWRRVLLANPRINMVATVDPVSPEASHRELKSSAFDAAIIATPTPTHHRVAADLMARCGHVFVEKPLAATSSQCANLVWLADGQPRVGLAVGHVERFNPAVRALAEVLDSGAIGTPLEIACARLGGYPTAVTPGNNVLLDLAVHDLDILRTLLGPLQVVGSVSGATVRPDVCDSAAILLSSSTAFASVRVNWTSPMKHRQIHVTGSRGAALVDLIAQTVDVVVGEKRTPIPVPRAEPLALELDAFADLIEGKDAAPLCSGEDAAAAVALAERSLSVAGSLARAA